MFSLIAYYAYLNHVGVRHHSPLKEVKPPRPSTLEREFYTDADAEAILQYSLSSADEIDRLGGVVLATLNYTGLRLDELVNARLDQLDLPRRRIRVVGKGRKPRTVPIPHSLEPILDDYLTNMRPMLKQSPFVFVNPRSDRLGANAGKVRREVREPAHQAPRRGRRSTRAAPPPQVAAHLRNAATAQRRGHPPR